MRSARSGSCCSRGRIGVFAMGSYGEPRNKGIDCSPGALVWVRRRNGSWWPGLVVPPEGLPRRRKGMPVKLLGKEDGSMDWYDLEKSKRIKAFRCGEYDECIKKAKASAQCSHKADRPGGYARREDAIIHALELERIHDTDGKREFYSGLIQVIGQRSQQGPPKEKTRINKKVTKVRDTSSQSVNSSEYHRPIIPEKVRPAKKRKWRTLSDNLDGGLKEEIRMEGDLGVEYKRASALIDGVGCCDLDLVDDFSVTDTNFNSNLLRRSPLHHMDIYSAKRGQRDTQLNEVPKRKNRRRPITKVLESTARVILPSFNSQEGSPGPEGRPSLFEAVQNKFVNFDSSESKKTEFSVVINNSSEYSENSCPDVSGVLEVTKDDVVDQSCFSFSTELSSAFVAIADGIFDDLIDVPVPLEENYNGDYYPSVLSHTSKDVCNVMIGRDPSHIGAATSSLERNLRAANVDGERQKGKNVFSTWNLNGRNLGRATRLNEETLDTAGPSKSLLSACDVASFPRLEDKMDGISWSRLLELNDSVQLMSSCDLFPSKRSDPLLEHICEIADVGCTYSVCSCKMKELVDCSNISQIGPHGFNGVEDLCKNSSSLKLPGESLAEEMIACRNPNAVSTLPGFLYDVKVGLQATDKEDAHVPFVSLTNKVIGKAVVGHPIPVQIVEGNYLNIRMPSRSLHVAVDISDKHSRASMPIESADIMDAPSSHDNKKKHKVRGSSKSRRKYKKRDPDRHRVPTASQVKRPKILPRKIRKLSSITVDRGAKETLGMNMAGRLVACVPAKLVFGRITEALGCPTRQDGRA